MKTCGELPKEAAPLNELAINAGFDGLPAPDIPSEDTRPVKLFRWLVNGNVNGAAINFMAVTKSGDRVCGLSLPGESPNVVTILQKMPQFGTPSLDKRGGTFGDLVVWGDLESHDRPTYTYSYGKIGSKSSSGLKVIYRLQ